MQIKGVPITDEIRDWIKENVDLTIYREYDDNPFPPEEVATMLENIREDLKSGSTQDPVELLKDQLYDKLIDAYESYSADLENDAASDLAEEFDLSFEDALDVIQTECGVNYPIDDYLNDKYKVVVKMDTGDADSEFTCNYLEPAWNGDPIHEISDKSAILWLAQQNGYVKESFMTYMTMKTTGVLPDDAPLPFIHSIYQELENTSSHCNMVVFLGQMSLADLAVAQKEGVTIPRSMTCGLYDHWNGAGGVMGVNLESDIYIPPDKTLSIAPDYKSTSQYSIDDTYGFTRQVWETPFYVGEAPLLSKEQTEKLEKLLTVDPSFHPSTNEERMKAEFSFEFRRFYPQKEIYKGMRNIGDIRSAEVKALTPIELHYFNPEKDTFIGREAIKKFLSELPISISKESERNIFTVIDIREKHLQ